jgi:hypothetical protein
MTTPSAKELEAQLLPPRPRDLPHEALAALREHSKRMFGNQDRLEVAVAISRVTLGEVNATDLHQDVDVAVNRIRKQLLDLEALELLAKTGGGGGKRLFKVIDRDDRYWKFAVDEYEMIERRFESSKSKEKTSDPLPNLPRHFGRSGSPASGNLVGD